MAKIIVLDTGREGEILDNSEIKYKAEELGILFGCKQGRCGTCRTNVMEGIENLGEKNEKEINMGLEGNERLMCQCKIKSGVVKLKQY